MYTVKEVAKQLNLSEHTIRFYTDKGLVPMVTRDKNNIRLFGEDAINCLTAIKCLRDTGMPLEAIKHYIDLCLEGDDTIPMRQQIIIRQRNEAKLQLEEAQKRLDFLNKKVEIYDQIVSQKIPDTMNPRNWPERTVV